MQKPLKILVLEDVQDDVGLIERELRKGGLTFETTRVDSKQGFIEALRQYEADIILSDHSLPQFNSFEALKLCRRSGVRIPFILVTGSVSEEFAVTCLKEGADDYVLKSNLIRLPNAIVNSLKQKELENERKKSDEAIREQNEELVKINRELDSFVYSVSHNLRAPLMSVLGLLNLARLQEGKEEMNQYFQMMEQSIQKLDNTLKEILDYSRNARKDVDVQQVDIRDIVNDSIKRLLYMEGSEKITKTIDIIEQSPLYSDAYRLLVIFNNLLSNSIKYRDPQKEENFIHFYITIEKQLLTIRVQDNGIGIPSHFLPKVFNMFYRATERSEGAGLGLYIVRETVQKLGGKVDVHSEYGIGTTFEIEIPNKLPGDINV
ncbi:ATP-binding protein [Chryseolinea sp. H1M3-3]|jgi:signal transduction histidine kinase|uniref:sensor histidine kinase n=1 Tax=Chryseolinea sp. H1M3-3 TaxID=3034144 RepID=UPI0023ECB09D|nr:ATP-binding protein [Chryseolinea sp. H1M3-3]